MDPAAVTLDEALQLLALPRPLGTSPDRRRGARLLRQVRPLPHHGRREPQPRRRGRPVALTITLDQALAIFAQPKQFRGRGAPRAPLKTFGADPVSGKAITLKDGKFGLYITDGETNATLKRGDQPEDMTPERAQELLAERREYLASPEGQEKAALRAARRGGRGARGPGPRRRRRRRPGRRRRRRPRR